ncbi:MAG: prepilin-type N-terminal cleavage/methylation domain-containing protein [Gemmatimonadaceae bacterium]|nr:prepilin-type N-terminal cleavage/methylation domain-containing protein [Gemmatimonadaceae bacterium]MCW5825561.1 prepilin-type N-terminal cleavage/methylation domain-containing protein [Gemmatimonadaceae bacterium]
MQVSTVRRGFTLIELLIVVVIIGVLAAIAIPKFAASKNRAHLAALRSDLRNLTGAQMMYRSEQSPPTYAADLAELGARFQASSGVTVTIVAGDASGFRATATHASLGGRKCAIFRGATPEPPATVEGEVACE